jgi:hypothetical protein
VRFSEDLTSIEAHRGIRMSPRRLAYSLQVVLMSARKVQGRFREGSGKVQGRFREGSGKAYSLQVVLMSA